jgi:hypothetical protein
MFSLQYIKWLLDNLTKNQEYARHINGLKAGVGTKRAKELTLYYKVPNFMDILIKFEKNTLVSVVS